MGAALDEEQQQSQGCGTGRRLIPCTPSWTLGYLCAAMQICAPRCCSSLLFASLRPLPPYNPLWHLEPALSALHLHLMMGRHPHKLGEQKNSTTLWTGILVYSKA